MSEPERLNDIMRARMERKETTDELDGKFLDDVQEKFFNLVKSKGYDIEPRSAYEKFAVFLAEVIAFFCPKIYAVYDYKPYAGPKKGIIVSGEVGRGKTKLARAGFSHLTGVFKWYRQRYHEEPGADLVWSEATRFSTFSASEGPSYVKEILYGHQRHILFFDDLGNERTAKIYGNQTNGEEIIRARNESLERFHIPTIFTTNLIYKDIEMRYGSFNSSRINGDYNFIFLDYPVDRRTQQHERLQIDHRHVGDDGSEHLEIDHEAPEEETGTCAPDMITDQLIQDRRNGKPIPDFYKRSSLFLEKLKKKVGEKEAEELLKTPPPP